MSLEPESSSTCLATHIVHMQCRIDKLEHAVCTLIEQVTALQKTCEFQADQIVLLHNLISHAQDVEPYVDELQLSTTEKSQLDEMFGGLT